MKLYCSTSLVVLGGLLYCYIAGNKSWVLLLTLKGYIQAPLRIPCLKWIPCSFLCFVDMAYLDWLSVTLNATFLVQPSSFHLLLLLLLLLVFYHLVFSTYPSKWVRPSGLNIDKKYCFRWQNSIEGTHFYG